MGAARSGARGARRSAASASVDDSLPSVGYIADEMNLAVRLQLAEAGPAPRRGVVGHTDTRWRSVDAALEHGALCRAFGLDPVTHRWDLPRSARLGEGRAYEGRGSRISGYLERHERGEWRQIGTVHVVREGEKFRDLDPTDPRDQFTLEHTR